MQRAPHNEAYSGVDNERCRRYLSTAEIDFTSLNNVNERTSERANGRRDDHAFQNQPGNKSPGLRPSESGLDLESKMTYRSFFHLLIYLYIQVF